MLALFVVVFISLSGALVRSDSVMPLAVKHALAKSFHGTAEVVDISVQTDLEEDKNTFLDMLDVILAEEWNFALQLDVNDEGRRSVDDHNLWFIDSYGAFRELLPLIGGHGGDSPVFYLIVLKLQTYSESKELMHTLFSDLFRVMVVNVHILVEPNPGEVLFYTYFPYQELSCHSTAPQVVHRFFESERLPTDDPFFPPKASNLYACPLRLIVRPADALFRVELFERHLGQVGLEGEILYGLAAKMNFTPVIVRSTVEDWNKILLNDTLQGPFKMLAEGQADIMVGFYMHELIEDRLFTPSVTYFYTSIVIALHHQAPRLPDLSWLVGALDRATWICTLALLLLTIACVILASRSPTLVGIFQLHSDRSIVLDTLAVALGMSTRHLPSMNFLRWCFVVWSMGVLIIRATYQGKLFDSYRRVTVKHPPVTVTQLLDNKYTIYSRNMHSALIDELSGFNHVNFKELTDLRVLANLNERNALIGAESFMRMYLSPNELETLITERLRGQMACMFFQKHSLVAQRANMIIQGMDRAGLLHYWKIRYKFLKSGNIKPGKGHEPKPITMQRIKFVMVLLMMPLYVLAGAVFLAELLWRRLQRAGLL